MKNIDIYKIKTIFHFFQIESTDVPLYLRMSHTAFRMYMCNIYYVKEDIWHQTHPLELLGGQLVDIYIGEVSSGSLQGVSKSSFKE